MALMFLSRKPEIERICIRPLRNGKQPGVVQIAKRGNVIIGRTERGGLVQLTPHPVNGCYTFPHHREGSLCRNALRCCVDLGVLPPEVFAQHMQDSAAWEREHEVPKEAKRLVDRLRDIGIKPPAKLAALAAKAKS